MPDMPYGYDEWKTQTPEDYAESLSRPWRRRNNMSEDEFYELADREYDRMRDERWETE